MKQKRSARMRTRAKQKHVASDRARRENVPRHILFMLIPTYGEVSLLFTHTCPVTKHPQNM